MLEFLINTNINIRDQCHIRTLWDNNKNCSAIVRLLWYCSFCKHPISMGVNFCKLTNTCIFSFNFLTFILSHSFTPYNINFKCQVAGSIYYLRTLAEYEYEAVRSARARGNAATGIKSCFPASHLHLRPVQGGAGGCIASYSANVCR